MDEDLQLELNYSDHDSHVAFVIQGVGNTRTAIALARNATVLLLFFVASIK